MRWSLELYAPDLKSPTLSEVLSKALAAKLPPADAPADEQPAADDLDTMRALIAQVVELASAHKLQGEGFIKLEQSSSGSGMLTIRVGKAVTAQNLDERQIEAAKAARLAAAKAVSRKVVALAPTKAGAAPLPDHLAKISPKPPPNAAERMMVKGRPPALPPRTGVELEHASRLRPPAASTLAADAKTSPATPRRQ